MTPPQYPTLLQLIGMTCINDQLNLTARFIGVQYHTEIQLFLYRKNLATKHDLRNFEHVNNCKNFASKSSKGQILIACNVLYCVISIYHYMNKKKNMEKKIMAALDERSGIVFLYFHHRFHISFDGPNFGFGYFDTGHSLISSFGFDYFGRLWWFRSGCSWFRSSLPIVFPFWCF